MSFQIQKVHFSSTEGLIKVSYTQKFPGNVVNSHVDYLDTIPIGNWTTIKFNDNEYMSYCDFLNTMVYRNVDVYRKMCKMKLTSILEFLEPDKMKTRIRIMNMTRILDPTFEPPMINLKCGWQKQLLNDMCNSTSFHILSVCRNTYRLERYFNILKTI